MSHTLQVKSILKHPQMLEKQSIDQKAKESKDYTSDNSQSISLDVISTESKVKASSLKYKTFKTQSSQTEELEAEFIYPLFRYDFDNIACSLILDELEDNLETLFGKNSPFTTNPAICAEALYNMGKEKKMYSHDPGIEFNWKGIAFPIFIKNNIGLDFITLIGKKSVLVDLHNNTEDYIKNINKFIRTNCRDKKIMELSMIRLADRRGFDLKALRYGIQKQIKTYLYKTLGKYNLSISFMSKTNQASNVYYMAYDDFDSLLKSLEVIYEDHCSIARNREDKISICISYIVLGQTVSYYS